MGAELEGASALELLRRENELLKQTIDDASVSIDDLEKQLIGAGVELPQPPALLEAQVCTHAASGLPAAGRACDGPASARWRL
jgi:hypothetical protein